MAVDVSLQDVRDKFAEFDAISDANVNGSIVSAKLITSLTDDITLYCTAHILAVFAEETGAADGGSGVVSSERIGPRTVEYETQAQDAREVFFATTAYGRMVLALEKRNPNRIFSVVVA